MRASRIPFYLPAVLLTLAFSIGILVPAVAQQRPLHTGASRQIGNVQRLTQSTARASTAVIPQKRDVRYTVKQIGVLPGHESSFLPVSNSINNNGVVAGYCFNGPWSTKEFFESSTAFIGYPGKLKALPPLSDCQGAFALGLNDNNQVFGVANKVYGEDENGNPLVDQIGMMWDHGEPIKLPTSSDLPYALPSAINNCGDMVGTAWSPSNGWLDLPVWWHHGQITQLPLPDGTESVMYSINNRGQSLGMGDRADGQWVAFLVQNSVVTDLNVLVPAGTPLLQEPGGINDHGVIGVTAWTLEGKVISLVLTPKY
jgi:uncharacterized membrane protein